MEIRLCPRCARGHIPPATRCRDCDVALQVHDESQLIGSQLGNYTLERVLGSGGMGVVFAARHQNLLREAAIKVLQPELDARAGSSGSEFAQRFLREARLLATLEHPNIVGIYDFDVSPWGFPYLVMPRLRGETLRNLLGRHPNGLPLGWIATIAGDIAAGLAHAHRHGVVHRDLKPENVFLALESDGLRAKLLDFGIAHAGPDDDLLRTGTGTVMGTPLYQAPEQLRGESVSAATDQYSYALLLAELLRGMPVRQGRSLTDILLRDSQAPLPRDALPGGIAAPLLAALARATEPQPAQRFASIGELLANLQLPAAEREPFAQLIDDGSSALPLTVVVSPPADRHGLSPSLPTTPPPQRAAAPATAAPVELRGAARQSWHGKAWIALAALLALCALAGFALWRAHGSPATVAAATTAWLRETESQPLPPGLLAPLAETQAGLLLRSTGGWSLFDPASASAGASASLGVSERLLGVDDEDRLWLAHDGAIETLATDANRRTTRISGAELLRDDAQTRWTLAASGRWLARLDADGRLRLLRVNNEKIDEWISSDGAAGDSSGFALGDRYAVLVRQNGPVEVFDLEQRRSAWQADFGAFRVRAIALDETLDRLAVAGDGERLGVWQLHDGKAVAAPRPGRELRALLWLRDGARLLAADSENLSLWQWRDGQAQQQQQLPGGADWLYRGQRQIYAGSERRLRRLDFGLPAARRVNAELGDTWAIAADAHGVYAGGSRNGDLVRLEPGAAAPLRRKVHNEGITDLQLYRDRLISSSDDNTIAVWRLPSLELEWRAKGHEFLINQLAGGASLWSSSSDGSLRRWRWPELELAETLDLRPRIAADLELHALRAFGQDEELLAGSWNHRLIRLRRDGEGWQLGTAPFEARTGYRLVELTALRAVLALGLNPGRLAVIDRDSDRIVQLPRDTRAWHAAAADADGRSVWLGGDAAIARLQLERRADGGFSATMVLRESSDYGQIGALTLTPAADGAAPQLAFGNERGELLFVDTADLGNATATSSRGEPAAPFENLERSTK